MKAQRLVLQEAEGPPAGAEAEPPESAAPAVQTSLPRAEAEPFFSRVTAPHEEIQGQLDRIRARVLTWILLLGFPLGALSVGTWSIGANPPHSAQLPILIGVICVLGGAWLVSRSSQWRWAAGVTIAVTIAHSLLTVWWAPEAVGVMGAFGFLVLPLCLTGALFSWRKTLALAALITGAVGLLG